jgi:putative flippase GtrA
MAHDTHHTPYLRRAAARAKWWPMLLLVPLNAAVAYTAWQGPDPFTTVAGVVAVLGLTWVGAALVLSKDPGLEALLHHPEQVVWLYAKDTDGGTWSDIVVGLSNGTACSLVATGCVEPTLAEAIACAPHAVTGYTAERRFDFERSPSTFLEVHGATAPRAVTSASPLSLTVLTGAEDSETAQRRGERRAELIKYAVVGIGAAAVGAGAGADVWGHRGWTIVCAPVALVGLGGLTLSVLRRNHPLSNEAFAALKDRGDRVLWLYTRERTGANRTVRELVVGLEDGSQYTLALRRQDLEVAALAEARAMAPNAVVGFRPDWARQFAQSPTSWHAQARHERAEVPSRQG